MNKRIRNKKIKAALRGLFKISKCTYHQRTSQLWTPTIIKVRTTPLTYEEFKKAFESAKISMESVPPEYDKVFMENIEDILA